SQIPTRITSDPAQDSDAIWSPDGNEIVFASNRNGTWGLYRRNLRGGGPEELLLKSETEVAPTDWTRDGRFIVYNALKGYSNDIFALLLISGERKPIPIAATAFNEYGGKTSPDGKWIAYASNETGELQIYVQSFPGPGEKRRVSSEFGVHPRWRADGRE